MDDLLSAFASDLQGRITGPFAFRLVLQPTMAAIYALRDGVRDAKSGRPAYLWTMLTRPSEGRQLLAEGSHAVMRVIVLGVIMDLAYQVMVFRRIHPLELGVVVVALAFIPYMLLRGPFNRLARFWIHPPERVTTP
jgi:hypothetical protein